MRKLVFIIQPLFLLACINENTLHSSFPAQSLHANSAKVWILSNSSKPNDNRITQMKAYRKTFTFYSNFSFREQELIHLGSNEGLIGKYKIEEDGTANFQLTLEYQAQQSERYTILNIGDDNLRLQDIEGDHTEWELETLKPPTL